MTNRRWRAAGPAPLALIAMLAAPACATSDEVLGPDSDAATTGMIGSGQEGGMMGGDASGHMGGGWEHPSYGPYGMVFRFTRGS